MIKGKLEGIITSAGCLYDARPSKFNMTEFGHSYFADIISGQKRGGHYHKHKTEIMVCTSGTINYEIEGESGYLRDGEYVIVMPNEMHTFWVVFDKALLVVYCDTPFDPDDVYIDKEVVK